MTDTKHSTTPEGADVAAGDMTADLAAAALAANGGPPVPPAPPVRTHLGTVTSPDTGTTVTLVVDADAFAKAFAAALVPVLEAHRGAVPAIVNGQLVVPSGYALAAPAKKQSFWSHAWHPDVLLSGLAMVIVIILLVAWAG
jgi:hypothetical protein